MKLRNGFMTTAAAAAAFTLVALTGAPAMAATSTWHYGDACHNVVRSETGATLSQTRTGIRGSGGSSAGLSQITVWYGAGSGTAWAGSLEQSGPAGSLTYWAGKLRINWSGGKAGECSGKSTGLALNAGRPGGRIAGTVPDSAPVLESGTVDGVDVIASDDTSTGGVSVSAEANGFTSTAVFTEEQVAKGEAQILLRSSDEDEGLLVTYDPAAVAPIDVTSSDALPAPQR